MAAILGEVTAEFDGKTYRLRLTNRKIAQLQTEFGQNFITRLQVDEDAGGLPDFGICLRMIELSLGKQAEGQPFDLADELFSADQGLIGRVFKAAFPDAEVHPAGSDDQVEGVSAKK